MKVVKVDYPQPSVKFEENAGLHMELCGLSIAVTAEWRTKYGLM